MKYIIYIIIFFIIHSVQAQTYIKGKYDSKNHLFITKDTTYWIDFFQEGVARISNNGLFGLMNKKGKILCPPKYDLIYDVKNGLAITNIGEKFGIIDSKGKELIAPQYEGLEFLKDDIFVVKKDYNHFGLIKSNGTILLEPQADIIFKLNKDSSLIYYNYGKVGFIDEKSWTKIPVFKTKRLYQSHIKERNISILYMINRDLLAFECSIRDKNNQSPPYNMETETTMINPILEYNNGLTINCEFVDSFPLFGFMDRNLKPIIKAEYTWVNAFKNGYASVFKNEKCGIIDTSGNIIIPIEFNYFEILDNHHFIVKKEDKYGVIDKNNKIIIPIKYEGLLYADNDLYGAFNGNKWGVIDEKEQLILDYKYDGIANNLAIKMTNISMSRMTAMHNATVYYKGYYFDKNGLLNKDSIPMVKFFPNIYILTQGSANFKSYTISEYPDSSKYDISAPINKNFKIIGKHRPKPISNNLHDLYEIIQREMYSDHITQFFLKGIMNNKNELVIPLLYDDIQPAKISKLIPKVQTSVSWEFGGYWYGYDNWKSPDIDENKILSEYNSNLFIVTSPNCKYGVIDINHKKILELEYDYIAIEKGKIIAYKYLKESKDNAVTMAGKCFHKTYLEQASAIFDFTGKMIEPFKIIEGK